MTKLYNCPFCAFLELKLVRDPFEETKFVECSSCGCRGPAIDTTYSDNEARELWNKRKQPAKKVNNSGLTPELLKKQDKLPGI
jgi:Lar family restriction alleviation protein